MTIRAYLPHDYQDEVVPPPRATPTAWIEALPGDVFALAPADDDAEPSTFFQPGDVVAFDWTETYGSIVVTTAEDGTFTCDRPPDPRANCIWIAGDIDTLSESVESFVAEHASDGYRGPVQLEQYAWSARPERYRFETGPNGPRFVKVEG